MAKSRQLVLMKPAKSPGASPTPLGSLRALREAFAPYNTAPDGSPSSSGTELLHGPGLVVEIPTGLPEINQAMLTVTDDDIAWPVLSRACRLQGWTLVDIESGRTFISAPADPAN